MKKSIMRFIKLFFRVTGIYKVVSPWYSGQGSILMLHRICHKQNIINNFSGLEITPEYLEKIISYFKKKQYYFAAIGELPAVLKTKSKRSKFVVFTFDDGYIDNFTLAYPIFKKHNIPFTVFVSTSFPDHDAVIWWYMLDELVFRNDHIRFTLEGKEYDYRCSTTDEKKCAFIIIKKLILSSDKSNLSDRIKAIFGKYSVDSNRSANELALDWEMIAKMALDPLVTIGAHTANHFALCNLDKIEMVKEIVASKIKIESKIKQPVEHFAYPFGDIKTTSVREFEEVKRIGFCTATTTRMANVFYQHGSHLEALPRLFVDGNNQDISNLDMYVSGFIPMVLNKFRRIVVD